MTETEIAALEAMHAAATPGEWSPVASYGLRWQPGQVRDHAAIPHVDRESATLACAVVNALPALLALARKGLAADAASSVGRESLAQEIRDGLKVRGLWAPDRPSDLISAIFVALDATVATEREACALVAARHRDGHAAGAWSPVCAVKIAAAIRARGAK